MNITPSKATKEQIVQVLNSSDFKDFIRLYHTKIDYIDVWGEDKTRRYNSFDAKRDHNYFQYRLLENSSMRQYRLWKRVKSICEDEEKPIFLTMTFNDNALFFLNEETRRRYIKQYLRQNCKKYVANIDFGTTNKREHYHAIVIPKNQKLNLQEYRSLFYGSNINTKVIHKSNKDYKKVSNYINKLTNHALKDNGFYQRLIFSRIHK